MSRRRRRDDDGGARRAGPDPGGPLVAVCLGRRCSALRALAGTQSRVPELERAVRDTAGAVLVTADCLGPCALASVAAVAHRDGGTGALGPALWLTGLEEDCRAGALVDWVTAGGPGPGLEPDAGVPAPLVEAVYGVGRPPRIRPSA